MQQRSALQAPATSGWRGVLRSWMRHWSRAPWQQTDEPHRTPGPAAPRPTTAPRVLVVDDNPVNLTVIAELLLARGLQPVLATNGAEAVALACGEPFDLVLMDLQMPVLDGWTATAAIRRHEHARGGPAVPVVCCSTSSPQADLLATGGMNGSLAKPCDDRALEACLLRWCPGYPGMGLAGAAAPAPAGVPRR